MVLHRYELVVKTLMSRTGCSRFKASRELDKYLWVYNRFLAEDSRQQKIDSINIDFENDNILPPLNEEDLRKLGKKSKPVLLKKQVINRNIAQHPEVKKEMFKEILGEALYEPDEVIYSGHKDKPNYFNFVKFNKGKHSLVLIELADNKDNYEIVHMYKIKDEEKVRLIKMAINKKGD